MNHSHYSTIIQSSSSSSSCNMLDQPHESLMQDCSMLHAPEEEGDEEGVLIVHQPQHDMIIMPSYNSTKQNDTTNHTNCHTIESSRMNPHDEEERGSTIIIRPQEEEDSCGSPTKASTGPKWQRRRKKHSRISKHRSHTSSLLFGMFSSVLSCAVFLMMSLIIGGTTMNPGVVVVEAANNNNGHAVFAIEVVGRVFTTEECYGPLTNNDGDADANLDVEEYLAWVQELSGNYFSSSNQYTQLPLGLKVNFVALACGCDFGTINCCDANDDYDSNDKDTLNIGGTRPGSGNVSDDQKAYLFEVCSRTMNVIDALLPPPTSSPTTSSPTTSSPTTSSPTTSFPTTTRPTLSPSTSPTTDVGLPTLSLFTGDVNVSVEFSVNLGQFTVAQVVSALNNTVRSDLQAAYRLLALEVVRETFSSSLSNNNDNSRQLRQRQQLRQLSQRHLTVATQDGASFVNTLTPIDCNDGEGNCAKVTSTTTLALVDENRDTVEEKYRTAMLDAIKAGRLNFLLQQVNPDTGIITIGGPTEPAEGDGGGGIALGGIIAGAVVFVMLMSIVALYISKRHNARKSAYLESEWTTAQVPHNPGGFIRLGDSGSGEDDDSAPAILMGATPLPPLPEGDEANFVNDDYDNRSSSAGSSGWSSSAGISSLATRTIDSSDQTLETFGETVGGKSPSSNGGGSTLSTDLEAASGIVAQMRNQQGIQFIPVDEDDLGLDDGNSTIESDQIHTDNVEDVGSPATKKATQKDLESAIQAGDWAAVGATAAVLAAAGEGSSKSSNSFRSFVSAGASTISTAKGSRDDANNSKEGNEEVRAKDLDHLVDAGDWEGVVIVAASQFQDGTNGSGSEKLTDSNGDTSSGGNNSGNDSDKDSNKSLNLQVETNEVSSASHSAGGSAGGGVGAAAAVGAAGALGIGAAAMAARRRRNKEDDEGSMSGHSLGSGSSSSSSEISLAMRKRTALELAIEAGDWDKVGEAAAELDDSSSQGSEMTDSTPSSARRRLAAVKDPRASELDKMIDKKDWQGVVAAAGRFHELEGSSQGSPPRPPPPPGEEEAAARKQAEVWMAIAAKTKHSDTDGEGARAAADWAIARSLSALQRAERKGQLTEGDIISIMSSKSWTSSAASTSGSSSSGSSTKFGEQSI